MPRLPPLESAFRMLFMVAYDRDADADGDFPKEEVIGEAPQIDPPPAWRCEMKTLWVGGGPLDECV